MGYSYFALCGDPLLDPTLDPYPDGLLARLAALGENAVWLHVELSHLAALPWAPDPQVGQRRAALGALVKRAAAHGMKIFLYLNEPRSLPTTAPVFQRHPDWRGVQEGEFHAVCAGGPRRVARGDRRPLPRAAGSRRILHHHRLREPHQLLVLVRNSLPPGDSTLLKARGQSGRGSLSTAPALFRSSSMRDGSGIS